jgi:hypothetical protein
MVRFCCRLRHLTRRRSTLLWPNMSDDIRHSVLRSNVQYLAGKYLLDPGRGLPGRCHWPHNAAQKTEPYVLL